MRCLVVAALVAVLAVCARADEQSKAKFLEDRWPQCSQVVKGRLGAFHPFDTPELPDWTPTCANTVSFEGYTDAKVAYAPCNTEGSSYLTITGNTWDSIGRQTAATFTFAEPVDGRFVSFHMPVQKGDKPNFQGNYMQGTYTPAGVAPTGPATAFVQTVCDSSLAEGLVMINRINVTETSGTKPTYHFDVQLASYHACPLFPYTGKSVPPGGVAALVIVILCFVFEFGVCAWYHKTQVVDENPFTTADADYTNVE